MSISQCVSRYALLAGILFVASNAPAVLVYEDAIDGAYHPGHASPNTYNANTDSATDWVTTGSGDGSSDWGYRNTGPGAVSFGTSSYQGKISQSDPPLYTKVTGLTPGESYGDPRLYFVVSGGNNNWRIEYSLDGVTWLGPVSRDTAGVVYLVASTSDVLGTPQAAPSGDTRCYYPVSGSLIADSGGEIRLYVRTAGVLPDPSGVYRTVYDGFAYDDGTVPPMALNPQPRDGGRVFGASSVWTLSWSNPPTSGTVSCNVYFGDQNDYDPGNANHFGLQQIQSGVSGQSVAMPSLQVGNIYYWIVDCVDTVDGVLPGNLWSFDVVPASAATGVVISEFMAANSHTLNNSLGEADDWIELYNNSASAVDLTGWYLTDDSGHLTRWTFPPVSMPADSYLLVWASGENTVTNGEIHTSFKLSADGEYLGLVRPDGMTIEYEYSPVFPEQETDISYGVDLWYNGADAVILSSQSGCRVKVPASDIGTSWHNPSFDDITWTNGATGVGYETSGNSYDEYVNTDVQAQMYNQMASVYLRVPFVVDDPAAYASLRLNMLFEDGFVAYLNGVEVARNNAPTPLTWDDTATAPRSQGEALIFASFAITNNPVALLVTGTNVLAVHGLNYDVASTSLLIQPQLEATAEAGITLEEKRYYSIPTPGANNIDSFLDFVADTKFSVDRGFYSSPFSVSISCQTPGSHIRYTLDGSTPTDIHGTLYTGPVTVTTTTKLRAIACKPGWKSSDVDTQTYLFPEDVVHQPTLPSGWPLMWSGSVASDYEMDPEVVNDPQYSAAVRSALTNIPTLSIVTDQTNLFGATGIYDNPTQEGPLWERSASAEWINPDGIKGFQINCGLQIQGAGSRTPGSTPKHSLRIVFKSMYGPPKLDYKLFPDTEVDSFNTIHLRSIYNFSWAQNNSGQRLMAQENHDQFARDVQLAMGQETIRGGVCNLYINGLYWGLYHHGERPDAAWASSHFGGAREDWDALNHGDPTDGNRVAWDAMWAIAGSGLNSLANYNNFKQYCDVTALADYMIINHYIGNWDWDNVNWYAVRRCAPGEGYKFICWDSENSLVSLSDNKITGAQNNSGGPTTLFSLATASLEFKLLLADRIHKHFSNDGPLTPGGAAAIWQKRSDVIDTVIAAESARWGDRYGTLYTPNNQYLEQQNFLLNTYFPGRTAAVLQQYKNADLYPTVNAPEFVGQHGGTFSNSTTVTITNIYSSGTVYCTLDGSDPREYGTGAIHGAQYTNTITLSHSTRVKARCKSGSTWSALLEADFLDLAPSPLRVSEVMYSPRNPSEGETATVSNASAFAFIEIHNTGVETVGLVGAKLQDGITFDFSKSSLLSLGPDECAVVVENPAAFALRYPSVPASKIAGEFSGDLATGGDSVKLMVEGVGQVVSFDYSDGRGWPLAADQSGHSLIPLVTADQSSGQLDYGGNWKASVEVDGSPGSSEPSPLSSIALNEVIAHTDFSDPGYPDYDSNDEIELINYGVSSVSLNGFYLSDDPSDLKKWAVPSGTNVPASGIILFDEITGFHAPPTNGFGLNKAGEQVLLSYASGSEPASVIDEVRFKGQENGRSLGRYPDATGNWRECVPTPGANNVLASQQPVISEIMYHPTSTIPFVDNVEDEFVEIFNPTAQPVNLWSVDGGTNIGSWRLDGEVDYVFPSSTALSVGGHLLVVPFDPANATNRAAFLADYGLSEPQNLFGPFSGKLANDGGRLALEKPLAPDPDQPVQGVSWVIVDEVFYADDTPWSTTADGLGNSLHRIAVSGAGVDPGSWDSDAPSPGAGRELVIEDPVLSITLVGDQVTLGFTLLPGYDYTIETRTNFATDGWAPLTSVTNPATEHVLGSPGTSSAFFRLKRD